MELMNCRNCKRIFNYITGEHICPACRDLLEKKFEIVKDYIRDNPGQNVNEVAENTEVSVRQLKKWVREERLTFSDDSLVGIECERCGKMIHSGRFCSSCADGLANAMQDAYRVQQATARKKPSGGKMRFLE